MVSYQKLMRLVLIVANFQVEEFLYLLLILYLRYKKIRIRDKKHSENAATSTSKGELSKAEDVGFDSSNFLS